MKASVLLPATCSIKPVLEKSRRLRGLRPALQVARLRFVVGEKGLEGFDYGGTVVFWACTMLRRPASRRAVAVTGPAATTAVLRDKSEMERRTWPPLPSSQ